MSPPALPQQTATRTSKRAKKPWWRPAGPQPELCGSVLPAWGPQREDAENITARVSVQAAKSLLLLAVQTDRAACGADTA